MITFKFTKQPEATLDIKKKHKKNCKLASCRSCCPVQVDYCVRAFLSRVAEVHWSMAVENAFSICNIMRANECFTTGESIQRDLHTIYYTWDSRHLCTCTCTAGVNCKGLNEMRDRFCIRARALMLWLFCRRCIEIYFKCKWTGFPFSPIPLWVTGNVLPDLINQCVPSTILDCGIKHTRLCRADALRKSPRRLVYCKIWKEKTAGQLVFICHSSWPPEHAERNEI